MADQTIAELIVPEHFNSRFLEATSEKTRVFAPMVTQDSRFKSKLMQGGNQIQMPFFQDLDGDSEPYHIGHEIGVERISDSKDVARRIGRAKGWTVNDLEDEIAGDDPLGTLINLVGNYWRRENQKILFKVLDGVFASNEANNDSDLIYDVVEDGQSMSRPAVARAKNLLGDSGDTLNTIAMHSDVYTELQIADEIRQQRDSEANLKFETYAGYRIIVDDTIPYETRTVGEEDVMAYTSYLFGQNAVGYAEGLAKTPSELDRVANKGETQLFTRRQFVMHPRGFKWTESSVTGEEFPTNDDLANGANWERVFNRKKVRIVKMVTVL